MQFHSWILSLQCRGTVVSQLTICFCCSFLLNSSSAVVGAPSHRHSPLQIFTWVLPTYYSSSWTFLMWVRCTGCSPSGVGCFSAGLPWGHKSCQQTFCSVHVSSLHGMVYSIVFLRGHSLLGAHPPPPKSPPLQAAGASAHSTLLLTSVQGRSCFTMICTRSCSATSFSAWSTSFLTCLTDPGRCRALFSYILIPLSSST